MCAYEMRCTLVHKVNIGARVEDPPSVPVNRARSKSEVIPVVTPGGTKASVKGIGGLFYGKYRDRRGEKAVERAPKPMRIDARRSIKMCDLATSVNAGIGAPCTDYVDRRSECGSKGVLQCGLNGGSGRLNLPAMKGSPVVFDVKAVPGHGMFDS